MFDPTKPYTTRDGRKCRIIDGALKIADNELRLVVVTTQKNGFETYGTRQQNGRVLKTHESPEDLVNVPEKGYIVIWEYGHAASGDVHPSWYVFKTPGERDTYIRRTKAEHPDLTVHSCLEFPL